MVQIWAFLVSIERYNDPEWPVVKGASNDTVRTAAFLKEHLQVPPDNILTLSEQDATREAIISKFQAHLIHNDKIQNGDAILFHFSGHGSQTPAPLGWTAVEGDEDGEASQPQLEMIIPWDEGKLDENTGKRVCGIPDRTIGALLDKVAEAHGNNITVVLDCCHSGHGTRGESDLAAEFYAEYTPRGLDSSRVQPIEPDVDVHILSDPTAPSVTPKPHRFRRGGFNDENSRDHVLMAACGPQELSVGNKKGGLLTTYWLEALTKQDLYPRTYAEVLKYVNQQIDVLRKKWPQFITQHPQCEGVVRDRLVFEETMMSADFFPVSRCADREDNACRIEAGEVHGIQAGDIFELHEMDEKLQSRTTLGSATAAEVHATYCIAQVPEDVVLVGSRYTAMVVQQAYRFKFSVHNTAPESSAAKRATACIRESLAELQPTNGSLLEEVSQGEEVDIVLEVGDDGAVTFRRLDSFLRGLATDPPRIEPEDVAYAHFPYILTAAARFNKHLALSSPRHPFTTEVQFEFHILEPSGDGGGEDDEEILEPKALIPFVNDEARIVQNDDDKYAFVLHNVGPTPLFPYLVYFDPATYAVETWYTAFEAEKATLRPHGTLQLGSSAEHPGSFQFYLPEGAKSNTDTSFVKLFVLDAPARMEFVNHAPVLGLDENGDSVIRKGAHTRASGTDVETKGRWDAIVRKITVVSE